MSARCDARESDEVVRRRVGPQQRLAQRLDLGAQRLHLGPRRGQRRHRHGVVVVVHRDALGGPRRARQQAAVARGERCSSAHSASMSRVACAGSRSRAMRARKDGVVDACVGERAAQHRLEDGVGRNRRAVASKKLVADRQTHALRRVVRSGAVDEDRRLVAPVRPRGVRELWRVARWRQLHEIPFRMRADQVRLGAPAGAADDGDDAHLRRRGHHRAGHRLRRRGLRPGARDGRRHEGRQGVQGDPRGARRARLRHPAVRGHALRAEGGDRRRRRRREDPHQPGQLRRRPQDLRGDGLRDGRGLLQGAAPSSSRRFDAARREVQEAEPRDAHRHQPRLALRARPLLLRRHAARHGRVGDRVRRHLPLARLPQLRLLDEGVQPARDGAGVPAARGGDVPARLGLPAPPRRHRGGRGRGRPHEVGIGIGALLADGLGDTIRVSLTEDPEREYAPCNRLAEIGAERLRSETPRAADGGVPTSTRTRAT